MGFKEGVDADIKGVFLRDDEFAEEHDVNGYPVTCVLQSPTAKEKFQSGVAFQGYGGISGNEIIMHVAKADLQEVPREGMIMRLDGKPFKVDSVVEDMGMLSIDLRQNVGGAPWG